MKAALLRQNKVEPRKIRVEFLGVSARPKGVRRRSKRWVAEVRVPLPFHPSRSSPYCWPSVQKGIKLYIFPSRTLIFLASYT